MCKARRRDRGGAVAGRDGRDAAHRSSDGGGRVLCRGVLGPGRTRRTSTLSGFVVSWRRRGWIGALPDGVSTRRPAPMPARPLHWAWRRASWPQLECFVGLVDVVHGTNFVVPPTRRAARVVTVHDLTAVRFPEMCDRADRAATPSSIRRALDWGAFVHTPSQFVADEVIDLFGADPDRVRAVHSGIPRARRPRRRVVPPAGTPAGGPALPAEPGHRRAAKGPARPGCCVRRAGGRPTRRRTRARRSTGLGRGRARHGHRSRPVRRRGSSGPGGSRTQPSMRCSRARPCSPTRRSTRASDSRRSRRWRRASRSCPRGPAPSPRSWATAPSLVRGRGCRRAGRRRSPTVLDSPVRAEDARRCGSPAGCGVQLDVVRTAGSRRSTGTRSRTRRRGRGHGERVATLGPRRRRTAPTPGARWDRAPTSAGLLTGLADPGRRRLARGARAPHASRRRRPTRWPTSVDRSARRASGRGSSPRAWDLGIDPRAAGVRRGPRQLAGLARHSSPRRWRASW